MFQQQNQCQQRLNCVLSCFRQLLKSLTAAMLLQEGIQESSLMATSSYPLKIFSARNELPFAWVRGRIQSYETTEAKTSVTSATHNFQSFPSKGFLDNPALICHFQMGSKIMTLLSWLYCTLFGESIFVAIVKIYISDIYSYPLNGKENISRGVKRVRLLFSWEYN